MNIDNLHSFLVAAECLSFTETAKRIYIGQSALSKQIAELEEELEVKLFIRHHRSLQLTVSGKTLLREGKILIAKVDEIVEKVRLAQYGVRGNLRIGCFGLEADFLPSTIRKFHSLYPQISIDIRIQTLKMIKDAIEQEELDLGFIVLLGNELKSYKFMQRLIQRTPLCFLLPCDHPYSNKASIDISVLAQDPFIVLSETECSQGFDWFVDFCKKRGFTPKFSNKTTKMDSVYWLVEANMGISFMPKDPVLTRRIPASIALVDMQGDDAYCNMMVIWKEEHNNPAIPLFLKTLESFTPQSNAIS